MGLLQTKIKKNLGESGKFLLRKKMEEGKFLAPSLSTFEINTFSLPKKNHLIQKSCVKSRFLL